MLKPRSINASNSRLQPGNTPILFMQTIRCLHLLLYPLDAIPLALQILLP